MRTATEMEEGIEQTNICVCIFRIDGGVSNNDFLMQMISDLIELRLERPSHTDVAALGAAFLAGTWRCDRTLEKLVGNLQELL